MYDPLPGHIFQGFEVDLQVETNTAAEAGASTTLYAGWRSLSPHLSYLKHDAHLRAFFHASLSPPNKKNHQNVWIKKTNHHQVRRIAFPLFTHLRRVSHRNVYHLEVVPGGLRLAVRLRASKRRHRKRNAIDVYRIVSRRSVDRGPGRRQAS